jgi:hypothetical protein
MGVSNEDKRRLREGTLAELDAAVKWLQERESLEVRKRDVELEKGGDEVEDVEMGGM